ncbi:MAG: hypothetical protein COA58_14305 [Bacteroidetes bacterium]|nr:MAG: hypothetical protein COA58_14305 [Bacteroidota bacterium]
MDLLFQIFGWVGAFGLLTAFYLNSTKKIDASSKAYQWINFICAILLTINAFHINSYPFIIINVFWAGVALQSIFRLYKNPETSD